MRPFVIPSRTSLLMLVVVLASASGCAPYRFGNQALFDTRIRTVHVPIVGNDTYRHDLGERLSDAIVREIELRTPYKVTGDPNADSTLRCRFTAETKSVLTETDTDDPRALDVAISVNASWVGRNGELLMQNSLMPNGGLVSFSQDHRFVPEAGQSVETSIQSAIEDLASRIVSQMEMRW